MRWQEKFTWAKVALIIAAVPAAILALFWLVPAGSNPMSDKELAGGIMIYALFAYIPFLLILSWRAAYVAGSKQ